MRRAAAVLSALVMITLGAPVGATGMWWETASAATARSTPSVAISIDSMSPLVPQPSYKLQPLRVGLTIENLTDRPLENVTIEGFRAEADRIRTVDGLQQQMAHPPTTGLPVPTDKPVTVSLGAAGTSSATTTTRFVTTVGLPTTAGFCLCDPHAIVPLLLQAYGDAGSGEQLLGATEAFVPSFLHRPPPVSVSWVWPLIDRPHRLARTNDFLDDDLAAEVQDGRLQRCLQVLERVASNIPITVVVDPELLDELQVMATTHYRYFNASGALVPGTGSAAARAWLAAFQNVLQQHPDISVVLTPPADPEIQSLARAGLSWSNSLPDDEQRRVAQALGGVVASTNVAWPPSGVIGHSALDSLHGSGYTSLILSAASVHRQTGPFDLPVTLAELHNGGHPVTAALTSTQLQQSAAAAMTPDAPGGNLSGLLAGIAVRLAHRPNVAGQTVTLTAPRYVDPDVSATVTAIEQSSRSLVTRPANLLDVLAGAGTGPTGSGPHPLADRLAPLGAGHQPPALPQTNLRAAHRVSTLLASLRSMFPRTSAAAQDRLNGLSAGVQRIESAAWTPGVGIGGRQEGVALARELRRQTRALIDGVHIITPPSRSYTLASNNSPLLITVENDLPYPADVQVRVGTVNGVPGLDTEPVAPQLIAPGSKATLRVRTQVQRSGRIQVHAQLLTPDGRPLGAPVPLTVNSTALGTIGVVITIVSGAVLLLALLVRLVRRLISRRRRPPTAKPWLQDDPDGPLPRSPSGGPRRTPETVPPIPPATP